MQTTSETPSKPTEPYGWMRTAGVVVLCVGATGWLAVWVVGLVRWNRLPAAGLVLAAVGLAGGGLLFGLRHALLKSPAERGKLARAAVPAVLAFVASSLPYALVVSFFGFQGWLIAAGLVIGLVCLPDGKWVQRTYRVEGTKRTLIGESEVPESEPVALVKAGLLAAALGWTVVHVIFWGLLSAVN